MLLFEKKSSKTIPFITTILFLIASLLFTACQKADNSPPVDDSQPSDETKLVASVTINGGDLILKKGTGAELSVTVLPADADDKRVTWSSRNTGIATVNGNGLVSAVADGNTTITATARDGSGKSGSINITVTDEDPIPVSSITINGGNFSLVAGSDKALTVYVLPADAGNKNVIWKSGNTGVVTVDESGLVSAIAEGSTTITATAQDGSGKFGSVKVTVTPKPSQWTFQEQIPGYTSDPVNFDVFYGNGMTLLGSKRTMNWEPAASVPSGSSGFSTGRIRVLGTANATNSILEIVNVQGPFRITVNYNAPGTGSRYPIIYINGESVKEGEDCSNTYKTVVYDYTGFDAVNVRLGCAAAIYIYDIKIEALAEILVESVSISGGNFSMAAWTTRQLSATVLPANATSKDVTWSSSNLQAATVSQSGQVSAMAAGTAVITAAAKDTSGKFGTITVTVTAGSGGGIMTAQEIFAFYKGQKVTTNGWADLYNNGAGLSYADPVSLTLIDNAAYPAATAKRAAFTNAIAGDAEKFIIVSGDIDLSDGRISDADHSYFDQFDPVTHKHINNDISFPVGSNTTIIGINSARLMFGGLVVSGKQKVIIRNVEFWDAHGSTDYDTSVSEYSSSKAGATALQIETSGGIGVWVDHCKFSDGTCSDLVRNYNHDGAFDIKFGQYVTVSWCEFTNHDKVMLVGSGDDGHWLIPEERQITLHHNYFHDATQRMPRTRGTQMHVYNNYYNNIGIPANSGAAMGPGNNAQFIVENNYFGVLQKGDSGIASYADTAAYPAIVWSSGNNKTVPRSSYDKTSSKPWSPAYSYTLDPNSGLPSAIPAGAGPKLVFSK